MVKTCKQYYCFNVFGKVVSVYRSNEQWQLFRESQTSVRTPIYDIVIPADISAAELRGYLDDVYHEYANEQFVRVFEIE